MVLRTSSVDRVLHGLTYLALLVWGVSGLLVPPYPLSTIATVWQAYTWAALLALGAVLCLVAVVTDRPWFEAIGLPPVIGGIVLFGFVMVYRLLARESPTFAGSILVISVLTALLCLLLLRRIEVGRLMTYAQNTEVGERPEEHR